MPDAETILDLLRSAADAQPTREIARAFALKGSRRTELRHRLRELEDAGHIERVQGRRWRLADDGELQVKPVDHPAEAPLPEIEVLRAPRSMSAPGPGDRFLARLSPRGDNRYTAQPLRAAESEAQTIVGQFRTGNDGGRIVPLERGQRGELAVAPTRNVATQDGDLVVIEILPARRQGMTQARIVENIGAGVSTTRSSPSRTQPGAPTAAGISSSPSRMSPPMSRRTARSTARPINAATPSTSPIWSFPCCPRRSRTVCVRSALMKTAPAWQPTSGLVPTAICVRLNSAAPL